MPIDKVYTDAEGRSFGFSAYFQQQVPEGFKMVSGLTSYVRGEPTAAIPLGASEYEREGLRLTTKIDALHSMIGSLVDRLSAVMADDVPQPPPAAQVVGESRPTSPLGAMLRERCELLDECSTQLTRIIERLRI